MPPTAPPPSGFPRSRFDAARCGIALYGLSPFGGDPAADGLEPALRWEQPSRAGEAAARRARARATGAASSPDEDTWIGIVPVGYADGFRRDMTGTRGASSAASRGASSGRSRWTPSPSSSTESSRLGTPVTLIGHGVLAEEHARVADTINYEIVCGIESRPEPRQADGARCVTSPAKCSPARRRGSSAARFATSSSARAVVDLDVACREPEHAARRLRAALGRLAVPALRASRGLARRARRRPHGRLHAAPRTRSRTTSRHVTSRSTRSPSRSRRRACRSVRRLGRSRRDGCCAPSREGLRRRPAAAAARGSPRGRARIAARCARRERSSGERAGSSTEPAGERILAELVRLSVAASARLDELGLLAPLGGSLERLARERGETTPISGSSRPSASGSASSRSRTSCGATRARCCARSGPTDASPRAIHRFRRATEPWALDALASPARDADLRACVAERARRDPGEPLLRGDELGLPPGPEVGRLLDRDRGGARRGDDLDARGGAGALPAEGVG